MSIWFEGFGEIECNISQVKHTLDNLGEHYVGVISLMPGLTSVELVEQGSDFVTIKTNDGLMKRTNISKLVEAPGLLGFFYRNFGSSNTGNAFLTSYKTYFEKQNE